MSIRSPQEDPTEFFVAASTAFLLHQALRPWGVKLQEELFDAIEVDERDLESPGARLSVKDCTALIRRARELTDEPGLGIPMGLLTHSNTYGFLSLASQSAATLGQTLDFTIRYTPALTNVFSFRLNRVAGIAGLVVEEHCDLGDVRDVLLLSILIGLRQIGCELTGREPWRPIDVAMPEPAFYRRLSHLVPELRFNQPISQIVLLESDLEIPLLMPDRCSMRLATAQCEHALQVLGIDASIEERLLSIVMTDDGPMPFEKVAATMGMSQRTLKRRLLEAGVSFSELVEKARCERALLLLRSRSSAIDDIAERLGYSTVSNLGRAFRRWTGMTLREYRREASNGLSVHLPLRR
jgi:AraC-like DNA-binding protein